MKTQVKTIDFKGQNVYTGIDCHLKNWRVTIMLDHIEHKTFSQDPNAEVLSKYLHSKFPGANYYSAYEAGFCGFSIHRALVKNGIDNIVVNPADVPTTDKERKQKEDKRDSRKIARSLRRGGLKGIYIPKITTIEFRSLVRYRKTLVKEISRNKTRIKSFLHFHGISIPAQLDNDSRYWSGKFTQWLGTINMTTTHGKLVLNEILDLTMYTRKKLLRVNKELRSVYRESQYSKILKLLCSIPGIGLITAVTFLSEIEDISRFKKLDALCSYVGLVPTTHSSGEKDSAGRITPRSNKPLRAVIVEAAWIGVRSDTALIYLFNEYCKRMKKNDAIIRIAKKLLNRIRYVMKNEKEYISTNF